MRRLQQRFWAVGLLGSLAACGGGSDSGAGFSSPPPAGGAPSGGQYVGYYAESATNNPEDPTLGAFVLNLPTGDGLFSGSMFFTYVGCQSSNVGAVNGNKAGTTLAGNWSGTIDGQAESGSYTGTFDSALSGYSGTYTHAGGKKFRDLSPCITYTIAANGTWEMFPVGGNVPAGFTTTVSGRTINWTSVANAGAVLVYVLDPTLTTTPINPVVWQTVLPGTALTTTIPGSVTLTSGHEYVAVVGVAGTDNTRKAFGSKRFTAP